MALGTSQACGAILKSLSRLCDRVGTTFDGNTRDAEISGLKRSGGAVSNFTRKLEFAHGDGGPFARGAWAFQYQ
jgi:hypothetical protein